MKTKTDFSAKPYNRCLFCHHRTERHCDGARSSAMELHRWCEYMRDLKELNGLTNTYIAEKSGVSIKTIERLMAQNCEQDIMRETARRIEDAIIGSSNQYPCFLAFEEATQNGSKEFKSVLDNIHASYNAEMQTIRDEAQRKIDYLLEQVERQRKENDYLRLENDRKAKIIDKFLDS